MKKILYLHGFASSGASGTVEILRKEFIGTSESDRVQVVAPDIPVNPADALPQGSGGSRTAVAGGRYLDGCDVRPAASRL